MGKFHSIDVCAAVIVRDGKTLLTTRPTGSHLAGQWEFPGGKVHSGETHATCIAREIREELNLTVTAADPVLTILHDYPAKTVRLHFLRCTVPETETPEPTENQTFGWFDLDTAANLPLAEADRRFVNWSRSRAETSA